MVLEKFSSKLKEVIGNIKTDKVSREVIEKTIKEIQKALISSDVDIHLVLELTKKIRSKILTDSILGVDKKDQLISIIYDELVSFLGDGDEINLLKDKQNVFLLVGLYGAGKTTTTSKLGKYYKERGFKVALISLDTFRPAAMKQLETLSIKIGVDYYIFEDAKKPIDVYNKHKKEFSKYDLLIFDSAGRDNLNDDLVDEILDIKKFVKPTNSFLVVGADTGQTAKKQAKFFKENLDINGVIITKLDGTAKGGGALSACRASNSPVRFIGTGEKVDDFEKFNSKNFVSQLLGLGDIETLLDKIKVATKESFDEAKIKERLAEGLFDLNDLYNQTKAMSKMGGMSKMMSLIPGFSSLNMPKEMVENQEGKIKKWKFMLDSMTKYEKQNPEVLELSRIERITKGSGTKIEELREMLKQYKMMKKMLTMFKGKNLESLESKGSEEMEDLMKNMNNPKEMMKMAKKFGLGGKMLKGLKKFK